MSEPSVGSSPYRTTKSLGSPDLNVPLRESGGVGFGSVLLPIWVGGPVGWVLLSHEWFVPAAVALALALALAVRAALRLPPSHATFSVRSGALVVSAGRKRRLHAPLDDVRDVRVSARVLRSNANGDIPAFAAGPIAALTNQQVDRNVGVLEVVLAGPDRTWRPTDDDERASHLEEVARTIRLHLRKHGWKHPDEREPDGD